MTKKHAQSNVSALFFNLCVLQPLLYGAATRLPLVFIGVHVKNVLGASWTTVGCLIGTFQLARATTNAIIGIFGAQFGHIFGTLAGSVGYSILAYTPHIQAHKMTAFWIGTTLVGFSEVIASIQDYCKREFEREGLCVLRHRLRVQYAYNVLGTAFGFGLGGYLYKRGGVTAAAQFGLLLEIGELLATIGYLNNRRKRRLERGTTRAVNVITLDAAGHRVNSAISSSTGSIHSIHDSRNSSMDALDRTTSINKSSNITNHPSSQPVVATVPTSAKPAWINYWLAITFGVQALMIGIVLSTGPLYLSMAHNVDIAATGYIFAAGELVGTFCLFAIILSTSQQMQYQNPCMPEPFNIISMIAVIGCAAIATSSDNSRTAVAAMIVIMGINDCATSATAECQGTTLSATHYRPMNTLANTLRRIGNTVTAFFGPMLYGIGPRMPFLVFGGVMVVWSLLLLLVFHVRAQQVWKVLQRRKRGGGSNGHQLQQRRNGSGLLLSSTFISGGGSQEIEANFDAIGSTGSSSNKKERHHHDMNHHHNGGLSLYWKSAPFIELECSYHHVANNRLREGDGRVYGYGFV